jgi:hypothetical protein
MTSLRGDLLEGSMSDVGNTVKEFFADASKSWASYIFALNVIGGVTMALLQTAKDLLPIRRWFQRAQLETWFNDAEKRAAKNFVVKVCACKAESDLLDLAANGNEKAFYDLQIEDLCALYNAAVLVILEAPQEHQDLLKITASRAEERDIKEMDAPIPSPMTQPYLESRNRVLHQCQRAVDGFKVSCNFRWKWIMQLASLIIAGLLAWIALSNGATKVSANTVSVLITALLSGFLAPVAKDLLAVLQKARGE